MSISKYRADSGSSPGNQWPPPGLGMASRALEVTMPYSFRASVVLALCLAPLAGPSGMAAHRGSSGHSSPEEGRRFELLGHADLGRDIRYGDVFFYDVGSRGRYAYMGTSPNFDLDEAARALTSTGR